MENTASFQLQLNKREVRGMARGIYLKSGRDTSLSIMRDLSSFESAPFLNLIDHQTKAVEGRSIVWKAFSEAYLGRLVAINIPQSTSGNDYENYLASLSADLDMPVPAKPPLSADRPLLTPSLGSITIRLTHALWDDMSMAFSVVYSFFLQRVSGEWYSITEARETDGYVLVGTHDRGRSTSEVAEDLIRRWKSGDTSRGEIRVRELGNDTKLTGDVRPVLLPESAS